MKRYKRVPAVFSHQYGWERRLRPEVVTNGNISLVWFQDSEARNLPLDSCWVYSKYIHSTVMILLAQLLSWSNLFHCVRLGADFPEVEKVKSSLRILNCSTLVSLFFFYYCIVNILLVGKPGLNLKLILCIFVSCLYNTVEHSAWYFICTNSNVL